MNHYQSSRVHVKFVFKCVFFTSIAMAQISNNSTIITRGDLRELIDSTVYVIDFIDRKFLKIGLDPLNNFKSTIQIISSSHQIVFSPDFLQQIFSIITHIISIMNEDTSTKSKPYVFLSDEMVELTKIVYKGKNQLSFQSKSNQLILNSKDVIVLQCMKWATYENVLIKSGVRFHVKDQVKDIVNYMKKTFPHVNNYMMSVFEDVSIDVLSSSIPTFGASYISQLKQYAVKHIAEKWFETTDKPTEVSELLTSYKEDEKEAEDDISYSRYDEIDGPEYLSEYTQLSQSDYAIYVTSDPKVKSSEILLIVQKHLC